METSVFEYEIYCAGTEMKEDIIIAKVELSQLDEYRKLCIRTFYETYADMNTSENMENYVQDHFNKEKLIRELNNSDIECYVAMLMGRIVGYIKINFGQSQTELKKQHTAEIERIYVLNEFQGNQIGKLLYTKSFEVAIARNATDLWLGVWEKNDKAIGFYKKIGFVAFDKHIFMLGDDKQLDIMMKQKLIKNTSNN